MASLTAVSEEESQMFNDNAIKVAKELEQTDRWQDAADAWNLLAEQSGDSSYLFQAEACRIIAEVREMSKEVPKIAPKCLMIVNGKQKIFAEEKRTETEYDKK